MSNFNQFISTVLMPQANAFLAEMYRRYCAGDDIGIETKLDDTPASMADRETEKKLRHSILETYPTHGIWGEEFGGYQLESPYIWVLDPLDGTKAFLNKLPNHFGSLIGLLHNGIAIAGGIGDPMAGAQWVAPSSPNVQHAARLACTAPLGMFGENHVTFFEGFTVQENLNCIGFAKVAEGSMLAAIEQNLALHDIVALIPVLRSAGAYVLDLQGNDYTNRVFSIAEDSAKKFGLLTSFDKKTIDTLLQRINA